ncbi:tyrosine-type recombinase/integrase [Paraburkholderia flava]|uniref:tyrosine-type recombinase/integrase n=1 Tax=Paraburkholderia flava TaxID=2547393 RepID=UPI0010620183|nr:site-specific integrase [Paraburkholderia flava]
MAYLISSESGCVLNDNPYDNVPVAMSARHRPVDAVNSFIRASLRSRRLVTDSVRQNSHTLTNLCSFLEEEEKDSARLERRPVERDVDRLLHQIDDEQLERWRDRDERLGRRSLTMNGKVSTALRFLLHCSRKEGFPHRIADVSVDPNAPVKIWYEKRYRYGRKVIVSDLLYRGKGVKSRRKGVPTLDEMEDAYVRASEGQWHIAHRDVLMVNAAEETGLRLSEVLSLRIRQLPARAEIEAASDVDREIVLLVVRKGGAEHEVPFPAWILNALRDYIDDVRAVIVKGRAKAQGHDRIFVSHTSGAPLNRQYMSRRLSRIFRDAPKRRGLTYHRVRARYASVAIEIKLKAEIEARGLFNVREEKILTEVMELMGQTHLGSLKSYLDTELAMKYEEDMKRRRSVDSRKASI